MLFELIRYYFAMNFSFWSELATISSLTTAIKLIVAIIGFYLLIQKIHMRMQVRFLKNISDEIIRINDFCIEFSHKYDQILIELSKDGSKEIDLKLKTEILMIRSKFNNHMDYLSSQIDAFPFGNPINFFWFSLTGRYISQRVKLFIDNLLTIYQDNILEDTVMQKDISINFNVDLDACLLNNIRIDAIIMSGLDIINALEDHSKKLY